MELLRRIKSYLPNSARNRFNDAMLLLDDICIDTECSITATVHQHSMLLRVTDDHDVDLFRLQLDPGNTSIRIYQCDDALAAVFSQVAFAGIDCMKEYPEGARSVLLPFV